MDVWGRDEATFRAPASSGWTFQRTISIGVVIGLLANVAGWVWWASSLTAASNVANQQISTLVVLPERVARIEERVAAMQRDVAEIKAGLLTTTKR